MTNTNRNRRNIIYIVTRVGLNLALIVLILASLSLIHYLDILWSSELPAVFIRPGQLLTLIGFLLIAAAEYSLFTIGGATGAPGDSTGRLVIQGLYRWVRNPVYLGGMLLLFGVALWRQSPTLLVVASAFVPIMHFVVTVIEEPRAEQRFGEEYRSYKQVVPRWLPRWPRRRGSR
jgi:protein-S-isoprenylcysteine O-methyltransferase Ste14